MESKRDVSFASLAPQFDVLDGGVMSIQYGKFIATTLGCSILALSSLDCAIASEDHEIAPDTSEALNRSKCGDLDFDCQLRSDPAMKQKMQGISNAQNDAILTIDGDIFASPGYICVPYYDHLVGHRYAIEVFGADNPKETRVVRWTCVGDACQTYFTNQGRATANSDLWTDYSIAADEAGWFNDDNFANRLDAAATKILTMGNPGVHAGLMVYSRGVKDICADVCEDMSTKVGLAVGLAAAGACAPAALLGSLVCGAVGWYLGNKSFNTGNCRSQCEQCFEDVAQACTDGTDDYDHFACGFWKCGPDGTVHPPATVRIAG